MSHGADFGYAERDIALRSKDAASVVARAPTSVKDAVLLNMAVRLERCVDEILEANRYDMAGAEQSGIEPHLLGRLAFTQEKLDGRVRSLKKIAGLPDPVGQLEDTTLRPNGLLVSRMRVPIGVILMIYEARPHVTVNGGAFALKSGNAIILRGGSEAAQCNAVIGRLWAEALEENGLPTEAVQTISGSHEAIHTLLGLDDLIDLVIPRGGRGLIEAIAKSSRIPTIKHFQGVCHAYVAPGADLDMCREIILDSKILMPEVCNALETVLIDSSQIRLLPEICEALTSSGVTIRGCPETVRNAPYVTLATEEDWRTEYLDLIVSMRVVQNMDQAIEHIHRYGSGHTDAIITQDYGMAKRFFREVDSSVVLVNASTMFCDGESLGMGAEIGISTDKLHARGPMGLRELTSYKFVIEGEGQVMGEP